ncbi:MAG: S41 family peptidase [Phycisphaerales bacterium]|nr:S41 family peptidase [Phycisphaerales bacterium]
MIMTALFALGTTDTFPQYPSLSPQGHHVVYSDRGDLWSVPATGGAATRLTSHPANELRSSFAPDGTWIAFESDRHGTTNIYRMPVTVDRGVLVPDGPVSRITTSDRWEALSGVSPDGDDVLFHAYREPEIYRQPQMYRAPVDGGPVERITEAFGRMPREHADGTILFTRGYAPWERPAYRGSGNRDVWKIAMEDQETPAFTRITSDKANEGQAFPVDDGLVLLASNDGQNDIWTIDRNGRAKNRTHLSTADLPTIGHGARDLTVSADGRTAAVVVWDSLHTLDLASDRAKLKPVSIRAGSGDTATLDRRIVRLDQKVGEVALHPSGEAVAVIARGEVLLRNTKDDHPTRRVTDTHARERHIAWSPDGTRLYFTSDDGGDEEIWEATVVLTRDDLKPSEDDEDSPAEDGEATSSDESDDESVEEDKAITAAETDAEVSEDDESHSESDAEDDKEKKAKDEKNETGKMWANALRFEVNKVVDAPTASRPMPSPDGRKLLYQRGIGDLWLRDLASGEDDLLLESWDAAEVRWASDSRHIVYSVSDLDFNNDIWLMDVNNPRDAVNLTRHPDIDRAPRITDDGRMIVFLSDRNRIGDNWEYDVWAIPLDPSLEDMTDYELDAYYKDAAKAAHQRKILPVVTFADADEVVEGEEDAEDDNKEEDEEVLEFSELDSAWKRAKRLTSLEGSENDLYLTPGGEAIVFSGTVGEDDGLWTMDHRGKNRKKITSGNVSNVLGNLTGKKVTFVGGRTAKHASSTGGKTESWPVDADARITVASEQRQKFNEAARTFGRTFYHPTMKNLDWNAISEHYADLASQTRTSQAFNRVVDHLFGEVNGSHTGIYGGESYSGPRQGIGYLGIDVEPAEDGYRVTRIMPDGPADLREGGLSEGDIILAVGDHPLHEEGVLHDLRVAMEDRLGAETLVDIRTAQGEERTILLVPSSYAAWSRLAREDEIQQRRDDVDAASEGRIGYLHIQSMSLPSVHRFEQDLYAAAHEKDGLIIDVRDNGGGYTTDILLTSLMAPAHAYTIPRGAKIEDVQPDSYPRDRRLLYGYNRPIVVLCNENSFSNAEIFSHAIKTTGRGTLVGEETFGGVISTGAFTLIDGTRVRQPFRGWFLPDGTDMESRGAIPDIRVQRTPADEHAGHDAQLDAAVEVLLEQLPESRQGVNPRPAP